MMLFIILFIAPDDIKEDGEDSETEEGSVTESDVDTSIAKNTKKAVKIMTEVRSHSTCCLLQLITSSVPVFPRKRILPRLPQQTPAEERLRL